MVSSPVLRSNSGNNVRRKGRGDHVLSPMLSIRSSINRVRGVQVLSLFCWENRRRNKSLVLPPRGTTKGDSCWRKACICRHWRKKLLLHLVIRPQYFPPHSWGMLQHSFKTLCPLRPCSMFSDVSTPFHILAGQWNEMFYLCWSTKQIF